MKIITYVLLFIMFGFIMVSCGAQQEVKEFEFEMSSDGSCCYLIKYNEKSLSASGKVIIPDTFEGVPVMGIGDHAFYACHNIKHVVVSDNVSEIGSYAFGYCDDLESIEIPENLHTIGDNAFYNCTALTSIEIPYAITIGYEAFYKCANLKTVMIGNKEGWGVQIEGYVFYKCNDLETANLEGVATIGKNAFAYCKNLQTINLSNILTEINTCAFEHCESLATINFKGTSEEWLAVEKWPWWDKDTGHYVENCSEE